MKIGLEIPAGCELMTAASMGGAEQIGESWYWNIEIRRHFAGDCSGWRAYK